MPTPTLQGTDVLTNEVINSFSIDEPLARLTISAYDQLCALVMYAHSHPNNPELAPLRKIRLSADGQMSIQDFRHIMSLPAMTHGSTIAVDIDPPMHLVNPDWTRVHQLALIHLHDALAAADPHRAQAR
jgi:hypothetical protein